MAAGEAQYRSMMLWNQKQVVHTVALTGELFIFDGIKSLVMFSWTSNGSIRSHVYTPNQSWLQMGEQQMINKSCVNHKLSVDGIDSSRQQM